MAEPYFRPLTGSPVDSRQAQAHDARLAAEIAVREEMAFIRSLGTPRREHRELAVVRSPVLLDDFEQKIAALDSTILQRGVAIDRDKLLELGKQRFAKLLELDRRCRQPRDVRANDLSSFEQVQSGLFAYEASSVPRRSTMEQVTASGKERDSIRRIAGWRDVWKAASVDPEPVQKAYAFHDAFASLVFGQSLLERLGSDGKVRSRMFCGAKGEKVDLFANWLSVLQGSHSQVKFVDPIWSIIEWLTEERATATPTKELASQWLNVRVPSREQLQLTETLWHGYLLGHREWSLWNFCGARTRRVIDIDRLESWRKELATRYRRVTAWHEQVRSSFFKDVGYGSEHHRQFDSARCRHFVDETVQRLFDCASALLALGVEETFNGAVVGRFQGSVLTQGKHKPQDRPAQIAKQLSAAFQGGTFQLRFEEIA